MVPTVATLLNQIQSLPPRQRAQVALASLRLVTPPPAQSPAELGRTVARRAAEVKAGTAKGRPVEEVLRDLRKRFK